jgi:DmsE family decaheme c-type cytochrome
MKLRATIAALLTAAFAVFTGPPASAQAPAAPAAVKPATTSVCANCHEAYVASFMKGPHAVKGASGTPAAIGAECTACHGDVSDHLKDPLKNKPAVKFGKGDYEKEAGACLACHEGSRALTFWGSGKHAMNNVGCTSCHSLHGPVGAGQKVSLRSVGPRIGPFVTTQRQLEYETCNTCHAPIRAAILKQSHHPIVEGKVTCSDCHNPHGALSHVMLKNETVNDQCLSCHTDKRGPYLFDHPAVQENCMSCHQPHGSHHNKLLNEKVPNLCQDCHDWSRHPGTIYQGNNAWPPQGNANTRFIARSCLNCHNAIHGSNAPGNRGKFLIR